MNKEKTNYIQDSKDTEKYNKCIKIIINAIEAVLDNNESSLSFEESYRSVYTIGQLNRNQDLIKILDDIFEKNRHKMTNEKWLMIRDCLMYLVRSQNYKIPIEYQS